MIQWHYPIWLYGALILLSLTVCDTNTISTVWLYDIKHEPLHCLYDTPTIHCVTLYTLWLWYINKTLFDCMWHVHYIVLLYDTCTLQIQCMTVCYTNTTLFDFMIHGHYTLWMYDTLIFTELFTYTTIWLYNTLTLHWMTVWYTNTTSYMTVCYTYITLFDCMIHLHLFLTVWYINTTLFDCLVWTYFIA